MDVARNQHSPPHIFPVMRVIAACAVCTEGKRCTFYDCYFEQSKERDINPCGRILERNPDKSIKCFLLAIHSYRYNYSFVLRFLFLQTHATSYSFYSSISVHCQGERRKTWTKTTPSSLWLKKSIQKPQVWKLIETSLKIVRSWIRLPLWMVQLSRTKNIFFHIDFCTRI